MKCTGKMRLKILPHRPRQGAQSGLKSISMYADPGSWQCRFFHLSPLAAHDPKDIRQAPYNAVVGCGYFMALDDNYIKLIRRELDDFCRKSGIPVPDRLRGAPLPSGDDVLLQIGKRIFFVGDAAGLIQPNTGAGIHYALLSAKLLAESYIQGAPYEEKMEPVTKDVTRIVETAKIRHFISLLSIFGT